MNQLDQYINSKIRRMEISEIILVSHVAKDLLRSIKEHPRGFTYDLNKLNTKSSFSSGIYLVGQGGYGKEFERLPRWSHIMKWLNTNLETIYRSGGFVGGWIKKAKIYLDVVETVTGRDNAIIAGRMNGEIEIYHPYTGASLVVPTLPTASSIQLIHANAVASKLLKKA